MSARFMWIIAIVCAASVWGTQTWLEVTNDPRATPESWLWATVGVMVIALVATVGHVAAQRTESRVEKRQPGFEFEDEYSAGRFQVSDEVGDERSTDPGPYWHR